MLFKKILWGLGAAIILTSCGTTTSYADGCGGYTGQAHASADNRSDSDAPPIYYLKNNFDDNAEHPEYIGTPGYYAVNEMPIPTLKQLPKQALPKTVVQARTYQYTIAPGDTVYALARRNCVSIQDIKRANRINTKFEIRAGDEIILPTDRCKI